MKVRASVRYACETGQEGSFIERSRGPGRLPRSVLRELGGEADVPRRGDHARANHAERRAFRRPLGCKQLGRAFSAFAGGIPCADARETV